MHCKSLSGTIVLFIAAALAHAPAALAATAPAAPTHQMTWGNSGSAPGQFALAVGVAVDASGNVYAVDQNNHRVQKFDRFGNFLLAWGSFGSFFDQFNTPLGIAVDRTGNVYVVDSGNHRIMKFTSNGTFITGWGSFGTGDGFLNSPYDVATDAAGNVYVADTFNQRIQKFSSSGSFLAKWGSVGNGNGQFQLPFGVAVDRAGDVLVADGNNHRVQKFTSAGAYLLQWGSFGTGDGQFQYPSSVDVDPAGNVYVSDQANHRIQKFTATGAYRTKWGALGAANGQFNYPWGIAVDAAANVYVADQYNHRVQKFSGSGEGIGEAGHRLWLTWGGTGTSNGLFNRSNAVAVDAAGNVYVVDGLNRRIQKFNANGTWLAAWGTVGTGEGQFIWPSAIAIDAAGNVYVSDGSNNCVQKFTSTGTFLAKWVIATPYGIAIDASGVVYVGDYGGNQILKFDSNGTLIGQWGSAGTGDGQFQNPLGIAIDRIGHVYVMDALNDRVQKFTSSGTFLTKWGSHGGGPGQFFGGVGLTLDPAGNLYVADALNGRVQKFSTSGTFLAQFGTPGNGPGQFGWPQGVASDATGNLYVADDFLNFVTKWMSPPSIAQVLDVTNDQGRQAQVRFLRSGADAPGSGLIVTGYEIYRRNDLLPKAAGSPPSELDLAGWTYLMTAPAHGESEYNVVVPTLVDATALSLEYTAFLVRAATYDPFLFMDSGAENGFSVDNLSPAAPAPFVAAYAAGATHLHWAPSAANDFATFRLYRGASADFLPGDVNLVAATTDTGHVDAGAAGGWYKLSAVDWNGNESPFAIVGPGQTTDVGGSAAPAFALDGARPNPARGGRLAIHFALPIAAPATLELFDLGGRRVAEREVGALGPGRHRVVFEPRGGVSPGIYHVRLSQGGERKMARITVLD